MKFKFELRDKVQDTITGFTGIVVLRSRWVNGCNTYGVQPTVLQDGKLMDLEAFDEPQLTLVAKECFDKHQQTGGPQKPVPSSNR